MNIVYIDTVKNLQKWQKLRILQVKHIKVMCRRLHLKN